MKKSSLLKKILIPSIIGVLAIVIIVVVIVTGGQKEVDKEFYDNETDKLVFSSQEVDKVFNPFFSTAAPDSNVVGLTQIGMLGNDSEGKVVYGDDEAVVTKDLQIVTNNEGTEEETTTYYFVLKNNVRFSNGSYLTIKDVLFNLYVYLDPQYTGSSTIYSTDIVGLKEYRTQLESEQEQDAFRKNFEAIAEERINSLLGAAETIFDDHQTEIITHEAFIGYLTEYASANGSNYDNIVKDYKKIVELFNEELKSDWTSSKDTAKDIKFKDEDNKVYENLLTTDVEAFLYNEGYITWNKKDAKLESSLATNPADLKTWTEDQAIKTIVQDKIPNAIEEVTLYWKTSGEIFQFLVNEAMEEYFKTAERKYPNISGIKFANRTESVTVNGTTYDAVQYNDGQVKEDCNEVLSITIKKVDPKAIWNFSFTVAPMYYYSDEEHINKFDFVSNFGVEYGSQTFMNEVVKNPDKLGVPMGAGPYAASKSSGGFDNVEVGDFCNLNVIYFERNPYYIMGPAKIKYVRYQVTPESQMLNSLYAGQIDFAEPNAKPEIIDELNGKQDEGFGNKTIRTAGYGYIGINAGKVPDLEVRRAIMHSINTKECVDYYQTTAVAIHRSMSKSSWAYPQDATPYYPYIGSPVPEDLTVVNTDYAKYVTGLGLKSGDVMTKEQQSAFITSLVESAGYNLNSAGIYQKGNHQLKYTFTIAGEQTDHPAWAALFRSSEILNELGFNITVTTDANALKKLSNGQLTVWAAAWGSTIDPDMYQVYHKDSQATSTLNWGYKQILANANNKYDRELGIVEILSEEIEKGRRTNDEKQRKQIYSGALDLVMELAVELPTYQRDDLFAYNSDKIDVNSFTPNAELSPYKGLTSDIHKISLRER